MWGAEGATSRSSASTAPAPAARPQGQAPDAFQPAGDALDALRPVGAALAPGADEHEVAAEGVGAERRDVVVRVDDVAAALRPLLAGGAPGQPLVEELDRRLVEGGG